MPDRTDAEILADLRDLDKADVEVSSWEADFIARVAIDNDLSFLTDRQREKAVEILEKYGL